MSRLWSALLLVGVLGGRVEGTEGTAVVGPALYYSALQAGDELSTRRSLQGGSTEANPLAQNTGKRLALKAGSAAALTFIDTKLQRRHKHGVWVFRVLVGGAYVGITLHNVRQGQR